MHFRGETYTRLPEVSRVAIFQFELSESNESSVEEETEMLNLIFYMLDKVINRGFFLRN